MKWRHDRPAKRGNENMNPGGNVVGLDIGATSVRATILGHEREPETSAWVCHGLADARLPFGTVVDGEVVDQETLTKTLRGLWRAAGINGRYVVLGVSHPQIVVRSMQMPRLPKEQFAQALPFRAKDVIALPIEDALLDFQPLDDGSDENEVEGLLVVAPRLPIVAVVRAVEAAGLVVASVDLAAFAALRAVSGIGRSAEAVVDLGAQLTNVVIHRGGVPRIVRTLPRGGQQLTSRLAERMGVRLGEAETLKCEIGLTGPNPEVCGILTDAVRPLIANIRGSIQYFSSANSTASVHRLTLTGGGAELPGLREALATEFGLETETVSPLQYVGRIPKPRRPAESTTDQTSTAVAVGLAIGAAA
jgi:type IV pilus assembly protein PilM